MFTLAVTAARGRGKSAALGLCVAGAIYCGYTNILTTAPSPENLQAFFDFCLKGLESLDYRLHLHYEVVKGSGDLANCIVKIVINKQQLQTIQYIPVNTRYINADLLIIDEAAALPLPLVRKLIGEYSVLLSSTKHGYEGTGRALSLKLLRNLSYRNLQKLKMSEPIRYARDDPIEQ